MRPDFLKQVEVVDTHHEQHGAQVLIDLVTMLADGQAPAPLRGGVEE